jgi:hypothetical protein
VEEKKNVGATCWDLKARRFGGTTFWTRGHCFCAQNRYGASTLSRWTFSNRPIRRVP